MKMTNNQLTERNDQIDKMSNRLTTLENFHEESNEIMENAKLENQKAMEDFKKGFEVEKIDMELQLKRAQEHKTHIFNELQLHKEEHLKKCKEFDEIEAKYKTKVTKLEFVIKQ